jgi:hypothetical protein
VRKLREIGKAMGESEPKPVMALGKDGKPAYQDAPDPLFDPVVAAREARHKAELAEIAHLRASADAKSEASKDKEDKLRRDLDGN